MGRWSGISPDLCSKNGFSILGRVLCQVIFKMDNLVDLDSIFSSSPLQCHAFLNWYFSLYIQHENNIFGYLHYNLHLVIYRNLISMLIICFHDILSKGSLSKGCCAKAFIDKGCSLCLDIFDTSYARNAHEKLCGLSPAHPVS